MRLHPRDAVYLYFDKAQRDAHIVFYSLLETPDGFDDADMAAVRRSVRGAFASVERFHCRLVSSPLHLGYPTWQPVESPYDLTPHLTRHPGDVSWIEAQDLLSRIVSRPMDVARPLWHMHVIPDVRGAPATDTRVTVIATSIHHCAFDGASFTQAMAGHFVGPEAARRPGDTVDTGPFLGHHSTPGRPVHPVATRVATGLHDAVALPRALVRFVAAMAALLRSRSGTTTRTASVPRPSASRGGRSRFGRPSDGRRRVGLVSMPLDQVTAMRTAVPGATLNDVVLGIVSEAARIHLTGLGEAPDGLVVGVPVAVHDSQRAPAREHTNQFRPMLVPCPTGSETLAQRLSRIVSHTRREKATLRASVGDNDAAEAVLFATPAIVMSIMGWLTQLAQRRVRPRAPADMTMSSVPVGDPTQTILGRKVSGLLCVQSLYAPTLAHFWTIFGDRLCVSVTADDHVLPDVDRYLTAIERSIDAHRMALVPYHDPKDAAR